MYSVTRLNEEMARRAGQLHARADKEQGGTSGADAIDAMVAAVAETAGEKVITENVTGFQQLGVGVESF
jgi:predicted nucleic acid-binding protein